MGSDSKSIFVSKTFWINLIVMIIGILTMMGDQPWIGQETVMYIVTLILPILNVILRWLTTEEVHVLPKK